MSEPPKPTPRTYNRLFAKSGNRCAFPKCLNPITEGSSLIGEAAHIKAENPGGARYDPAQTDDERRGFENLILLCANHHKVVDDDEEAYSVERLVKMKRDHEGSATEVTAASELSTSLALLINADIAVTAVNPSNSVTAGIYNNVVHHNYAGTPLKNQEKRLRLESRLGQGRFRAKGEPLGKQRLFNFSGIQVGPEVFLQEGPCFWMRLFPTLVPESEWTMQDLRSAAGHALLYDTVHGSAEGSLVAPDGIGAYAPSGASETYAVNFFSRRGEIWSIDTALCFGPEQRMFALTEVRSRLPQLVSNFVRALGNLGVPAPYEWVIGLEGAMGCGLSYELERGWPSVPPLLLVDEVVVKGSYSSEGDIPRAVEAFTKKLFSECARAVPEGLISTPFASCLAGSDG